MAALGHLPMSDILACALASDEVYRRRGETDFSAVGVTALSVYEAV